MDLEQELEGTLKDIENVNKDIEKISKIDRKEIEEIASKYSKEKSSFLAGVIGGVFGGGIGISLGVSSTIGLPLIPDDAPQDVRDQLWDIIKIS